MSFPPRVLFYSALQVQQFPLLIHPNNGDDVYKDWTGTDVLFSLLSDCSLRVGSGRTILVTPQGPGK